jgi:CDP-4-dehydro-6-deoxyglucose reductase
MEEKLQSTIIEILDESPRVKRFFLKVDDVTKFEFSPGQFVIIDFPDIDHAFPYRSYSIASTTKNENIIEICVVIKEDGCASPLLFKAQVGDHYTLSLAQGKFILPQEIDRDLTFICTGTGVAPFRSMIKDIYERNIPHRNIYLYFGNRKEEDILYRKEFEELENTYPEFHFTPILSQDQWAGANGYLHPHYLKEFQNKRDAFFYICGWTEMVREAKNNLKALGYDRRSIKIELYD